MGMPCYANQAILSPYTPIASFYQASTIQHTTPLPNITLGLYLTTRDCLHSPEPARNYFPSPILNLLNLPILFYPSFPHEKKHLIKTQAHTPSLLLLPPDLLWSFSCASAWLGVVPPLGNSTKDTSLSKADVSVSVVLSYPIKAYPSSGALMAQWLSVDL